MNRADQIAAEYLVRELRAEKLENQQSLTGPMPRFLNSPPVQDGPDRVSPLEAVAGFAVLGLVFVLIFWGIA